MANCRYIFSYPKYEGGDIFVIWLVVNLYFSTKNINPGIYLRLGHLQVLVLPYKR